MNNQITETRLDEAIRLLEAARGKKTIPARRKVARAIRHLIAHLAGKEFPHNPDRGYPTCMRCGANVWNSDQDLCKKCDPTPKPKRKSQKADSAAVTLQNSQEQLDRIAAHGKRVEADLERLGEAGIDRRFTKEADRRRDEGYVPKSRVKKTTSPTEADFPMPDKVKRLFEQIETQKRSSK